MSSSGKMVLLVEDNEDNRIVYSTILKHFGYEVTEALNGEEGIAKARSEKPDLIPDGHLNPDHRWLGGDSGAEARSRHEDDPHHRAHRARARIRSREGDGSRLRWIPREAL